MNNKRAIFIYVGINIFFAICVFYYPLLRDEFYYFDRLSAWQLMQEYYNSYFNVNPRIGQFVTNVVSRNLLLEVMYSVFLFNAFFALLFLLVFRRLPKFTNDDASKFLIIVGLFIILINVFGEMFFYTPYSGNYTFLMLFYMLYYYIFSEYFVEGNDVLKRIKTLWRYPLILLIGVFTGMGNEHVPPVLIGFSGLAIVYYLFQKRKWPSNDLILYWCSTVTGYLLLFFAPANTQKYKGLGQSAYQFQWSSYLHQWKEVVKLYYYYNPLLLVAMVLLIVYYLFSLKHLDFKSNAVQRNVLLLLVGFSTLFIVAYAPLSGTRLTFFSNTLFILFLCNFIFKEKSGVAKLMRSYLSVIAPWFPLGYFVVGSYICFRASENSKSVLLEIEQKSRHSKKVILDRGFDYYSKDLPWVTLNRSLFLDRGVGYIDDNENEDSSQEKILKQYFRLEKLSIKKNEHK